MDTDEKTIEERFTRLYRSLSKDARDLLLGYAVGLKREETGEQPFYELSEEDEQSYQRSLADEQAGRTVSSETVKAETHQIIDQALKSSTA